MKNKLSKKEILIIFFLIVGIGCLSIKAFIPTWVDESGILIEPYFFLIPVGFSFIFLSLIGGTILFVLKMIKLIKNKV